MRKPCHKGSVTSRRRQQARRRGIRRVMAVRPVPIGLNDLGSQLEVAR